MEVSAGRQCAGLAGSRGYGGTEVGFWQGVSRARDGHDQHAGRRRDAAGHGKVEGQRERTAVALATGGLAAAMAVTRCVPLIRSLCAGHSRAGVLLAPLVSGGNRGYGMRVSDVRVATCASATLTCKPNAS